MTKTHIKLTPTETFTFDEITFASGKTLSEITVKAPSYSDRLALIQDLERTNKTESPTAILGQSIKLATRLSNLEDGEFLQLPEVLANAILGFINGSN